MADSSNVTPIRPPTQPPRAPRKPRAPKVKVGLELRESKEGDPPFTTYDIFAGLCGVCTVLDEEVGMNALNTETVHRLSMAANVLAQMLMERAL